MTYVTKRFILNRLDKPIKIVILKPTSNKGEMMKVKCVECERVFNLADPTDSEMYAYGHDCEVE